MIITKKKMRKQIADLSMDLEIINPIESKKILAGGWYDNGYGITITYGGGGGSSPGGYWYDSSGGSYFSDWNNIDGSYGNSGGGGGSSDEFDYNTADGILEDPNAREIFWLLNNTNGEQRDRMRNNISVADQYGRTQPGFTNGLGDALRHSLWSALDAADIGLVRATEFHTLHEASNPALDGSNAMDLHNNNWGFNWFSQNGNPDDNMYKFMVDFLTAVDNGQIQTAPRP